MDDIIKTGIIYFFTVLCANIVGSISGMGGGVIIKPIMDALGRSNLLAINFYSSFAVFIMSIVSTYKQSRNHIEIVWTEVLRLAIGSVLGGFLGNELLVLLKHIFIKDEIVNLIQIVLLIITLILALIFTEPLNIKFSNFTRNILWFVSGVFLGTIATLLGIGGGPINVALIIALFSTTPKIATTYSIITILFSQISKLASSIPTISQMHISAVILIFIFFAAFIGGYSGAVISHKISSNKVLILYKVTVLGVLLLNIVNGISIVI